MLNTCQSFIIHHSSFIVAPHGSISPSHAADTLKGLGIAYEVRVVSAHRTPDALLAYAESAERRGLEVIIAGAGGAAHLPGVTAAKTLLPVLGVP